MLSYGLCGEPPSPKGPILHGYPLLWKALIEALVVVVVIDYHHDEGAFDPEESKRSEVIQI